MVGYLPPPISPLVAMADMESAVVRVIKVEMAMMINVCPVFAIHLNNQQPTV